MAIWHILFQYSFDFLSLLTVPDVVPTIISLSSLSPSFLSICQFSSLYTWKECWLSASFILFDFFGFQETLKILRYSVVSEMPEFNFVCFS